MDIQPHVPNIENNELQWVVAHIQSRRPSQALPRPKPATLATVIAHLREEEPLTAEELSEREREWEAIENELKAVEQADARKEGLL
jgi:hypothetical protein